MSPVDRNVRTVALVLGAIVLLVGIGEALDGPAPPRSRDDRPSQPDPGAPTPPPPAPNPFEPPELPWFTGVSYDDCIQVQAFFDVPPSSIGEVPEHVQPVSRDPAAETVLVYAMAVDCAYVYVEADYADGQGPNVNEWADGTREGWVFLVVDAGSAPGAIGPAPGFDLYPLAAVVEDGSVQRAYAWWGLGDIVEVGTVSVSNVESAAGYQASIQASGPNGTLEANGFISASTLLSGPERQNDSDHVLDIGPSGVEGTIASEPFLPERIGGGGPVTLTTTGRMLPRTTTPTTGDGYVFSTDYDMVPILRHGQPFEAWF